MTGGFKVVVPARYASTRLPGKPLLTIAGKPMIAHVCERALQAGADEVVVATDDQRIADAVAELGITAVMTDPAHQSGTERITEAARLLLWEDDVIVVNLQGDEPLIPAHYISEAAALLVGQSAAGMATLAAVIEEPAEIFNPNAVKVVINNNNDALYFSRAPVPWDRNGFNRPEGGQPSGKIAYLRHIGLYAYTVAFLSRYCAWAPSPLEQVEALEQLRVLWHGEIIKVKIVDKTPEAGVDTAEDLRRVDAVLSASAMPAG